MKKIALHYKCPDCGKAYPFDTSDLPAGFVSPDDLDKNSKIILTVEKCPNPKCDSPGFVITLEDVKNALENPKTPEGEWEFFWEG